MDSRLVIRKIKDLTVLISNGQTNVNDQVHEIASTLSNPYLLCIPKLQHVATEAGVDVSPITKKIAELKR